MDDEYSLDILKTRLAKGEITIKEFNELRNAILETGNRKQHEPTIKKANQEIYKSPSNWWYLLPILFLIPGGIFMFVITYNTDRGKAWRGLEVAIVMTILVVIGYFVLIYFLQKAYYT